MGTTLCAAVKYSSSLELLLREVGRDCEAILKMSVLRLKATCLVARVSGIQSK